MKASDYLKDGKGDPSSSRLMSYQLLWFFMIFNAFMWPLMAILKTGANGLDVNWLLGLLAFDLLLLIATFAPKQLNKISEMKEILDMAQPGQAKQNKKTPGS